MKKLSSILLLLLLLNGCVQKTYTKTVVFTLTVPHQYAPKTVGIRGDDSPLNWDQDVVMKAAANDSIYTATITFVTGYKYTSVKFVVNDEFELQDQDNRRIDFSISSDTTVYRAIFNKKT
jgi:PBP1b-binding outer membrane lipoprotein LpoB